MKQISITLTVDGTSVTRDYKAHEVEHIDWNPNIIDMADSISNPLV